MKKELLSLVVTIGVLTSACHNKPDIFKDKRNLTAIVLISSEKLFDPWDLAINDSILFVANLHGHPLLEIYNTKGKLLAKRISAKNSDTIKAIGNLQIDAKRNLLYISDNRVKKTFVFSIKRLLVDSLSVPDTLIDIARNSLSEKSEKTFFAKNYIVRENKSPEGRIMFLTNKGIPIKIYLKYPAKVNENLTDQNNAELYGSNCAISPDQTKFGMSAYNCDMLNFLNITNNGLDSIWSSSQSLPNNIKVLKILGKSQFFITDASIKGYLDADATNKFFYTIYSGKPEHDPDRKFGSIIRAISWDGKTIIEYKCDRLISRIAASPDDKFIYAVSLNKKSGAPEIIKFLLN